MLEHSLDAALFPAVVIQRQPPDTIMAAPGIRPVDYPLEDRNNDLSDLF
jgi:hypothetical protein